MVDENLADDAPDDVADVDGDTGNDDAPESDQEAGAEDLGDAGKRALDAMKAKWKAERERARDLAQKLEDVNRPKSDDADLDAVRKQARDEAKAETLRERVLDKIEAKAAKGFRDPEDALLRLGRNVDDYIDDGKIDLQAIEDDLGDLLKKRPDFGVTQGDSKRFKGTADNGNRGRGEGKPQLTQTDVDRMAKQKDGYLAIEAARVGGQLNDLLGITNK